MPGTTETSSGAPSASSQDLAARDLGVERQIDEVAGDREMIGRIGRDVGGDHVDDAVMQEAAPVALPVDVADHALGGEIAIGYSGERPQMNVGNMRKPEHHAFLGYAVPAFHPWRRR